MKTDERHPDRQPCFVSKSARDIDTYFKDRVETKINLYFMKARGNKFLYWASATVAAVGALFVPALNSAEMHSVASVVSLVVASALALEGVFHLRDKYRNYKLIENRIREEEMRFSTRAEPYAINEFGDRLTDEDRFKLLVVRVESAIAAERLETLTMTTDAPAADVRQGG